MPENGLPEDTDCIHPPAPYQKKPAHLCGMQEHAAAPRHRRAAVHPVGYEWVAKVLHVRADLMTMAISIWNP